MKLLTAALLLAVTSVHAMPIDVDPCKEEKTLVTRAPRHSPGRASPILSWVTVRSGGPRNPDAPRCLDETYALSLPEPEFLEYPLDFEPPALIEFPVEEEMPPTAWSWTVYGGRNHYMQPPIVGVPEPTSVACFLLGLTAMFGFRRPR